MTPGKALIAGAAIVALTYVIVGGPAGGSGAGIRAPDDSTILRGAALEHATPQYQPVSFAVLSGFEYEGGGSGTPSFRPARLPDAVARLHNRRVAVRGFMMPLDFDGDGVSRFILNGSYDMCQFGAPVAAPNQWIAVEMTERRRTAFVHIPLVVFGTLSVGEERREGRVLSLYRLQADAVAFPDGR